MPCSTALSIETEKYNLEYVTVINVVGTMLGVRYQK